MNLLSRRGRLAIAVVVDIDLQGQAHLVSSKDLAARLGLPPRHLEMLLQALVHGKILQGVRGPLGGYRLARDAYLITLGELVRIAGRLSTAKPENSSGRSDLLEIVIEPAVARASGSFLANLDAITVGDVCEVAKKKRLLAVAPDATSS